MFVLLAYYNLLAAKKERVLDFTFREEFFDFTFFPCRPRVKLRCCWISRG